MKHAILLIATVLTLLSCSSRNGYFTIEGRFLNLNQGEFYVYSTDGLINGIDTINVNGGRFAIEIPCQRQGTMTLVFPNFSEQPIFAEPGKSVDIKADASHLKQMEVTGTDDNELMTAFRQAMATLSPPEVVSRAESFIRDNAKSPVAIYLLQKYFIRSGGSANYGKAKELLTTVAKEQPENKNIAKLRGSLKTLQANNIGMRLSNFSAKDISGNTISNNDLKGKVGIICVWATWCYDSENILRHISMLSKQANAKYAVIGINVDASKSVCRDALKRNDVSFANICDEQLFDSKLLQSLGIRSVPASIVVDATGKVVARDLEVDDFDRYIK